MDSVLEEVRNRNQGQARGECGEGDPEEMPVRAGAGVQHQGLFGAR
jgi:hypothetical protein